MLRQATKRALTLRSVNFRSRSASTLVIAEHDGAHLAPITLNAISAAQKIGGDVNCFVAGENCAPAVEALTQVKGRVTRFMFGSSCSNKGWLEQPHTHAHTQKPLRFMHLFPP